MGIVRPIELRPFFVSPVGKAAKRFDFSAMEETKKSLDETAAVFGLVAEVQNEMTRWSRHLRSSNLTDPATRCSFASGA